MSSHPARIALHLFLIITMLMAGFVAPMQAIATELQATAVAAPQAMQAMDCAHMQMAGEHAMPAPRQDPPSHGGCMDAHCSLAACLGIACLPEIPHLAMQASPGTAPMSWKPVPHPARMPDTPLRPPIA